MANLLVEERCKLILNLDGVGLTEFVGISRAACGTSVAVPQLKIQLDAGNNVYNFKPDAVFITHCHSDHCYRVTHFVSRQHNPIFFMPNEMVDNLENYLSSSLQLSSGDFIDVEHYEKNHISTGVMAGDHLTEFCRIKQIGAHVVDCSHSVTCCGYAFYIKKTKLMKKYEECAKAELKTIRLSGETIVEDVDIPLFMFLGDTDIETFNVNNANGAIQYILKGWKYVFVECSFLELDDIEKAINKKHMHWQHLKNIVIAYPDVTFILMHFSARYKYDDIVNFFKVATVEENITNIKLLIAPESGPLPEAISFN
jgi:ribonuclease Z